MEKVCLAIIFNHRYDININKLKKIYKGRFSHIFYIVPFYNGKEENVIPVYECSFRFSGYVAQAYPWIKGDYDHYLFIADDMILHPEITESNYSEWFSVGNKDAYITWKKPLGKMEGWGFGRRHMDPLIALERYSGTNWKEEILSSLDAFKIAEKKGYCEEDFCIPLKNIWNNRKQIKNYPRIIILFFKIIILGKQKCPYPVWGGYSDIFIIPSEKLEEAAHMMGVFAAMNLFVEIAVPTALMLTCDKLIEEKDTGRKSMLLWGNDARDAMVEKNNGNYGKLINDWDDSWLCMHPIKLSQWKIDE